MNGIQPPNQKRKVLILSCNTGEGHNTAANAIREWCEEKGHEAVVLDFLSFSGNRVSSFVSRFYIRMAKYTPLVFGFFYHLLLLISRSFSFGHSILYLLNGRIAPKLKAYLDANDFDAVVATHLFAAEAISKMKNSGQELPLSIMVLTDYTCYPFLEEAACDYYVLPHEALIPLSLRRGLPAEKLLPWGIPIGMRFQKLPTREAARRSLGIEDDIKLHLIMGGSMGAGRMLAFTKQLAKMVENGRIIVICGKNEELKVLMQKRFQASKNVTIIGYTRDIPTYMKACDVLYTKPGGLTSTEALVCRTPTVHTAPIPGCEGANMRFFREHGLAWHAKTARAQVRLGCKLASDFAARERMYQCQVRDGRPDAAQKILWMIEHHTKCEKKPK